MRKLICSLLLATVPALAQQKPAVVTTPSAPAAPSPPLAVDNENARRAKALLDQMLKALGGSAYLSYQNRAEVGRTYRFYHGESAGTGVQFWRFWKYPNKDRMELTKQRDWIVIYNGDQAWETTFRGSRALDPEDLQEYLRRRPYANETVLREWLKAPGTVLFYDGATVAERRPAEKITIMDANNRSVSFYISSDTHLPIKKTYTLRDEETRERFEESEIYDNYRPIQGIQTPLSWTWTRDNEMTRQRFLNSVSYDVPMADSLFAQPRLDYDWRKK